MSRFDFILKHVLGVRMEKADSLSRRLDWKEKVKKDNENQQLIKKEWIREIMEVVVKGPEIMLIRRAREKNEKVARVRNLRDKE